MYAKAIQGLLIAITLTIGTTNLIGQQQQLADAFTPDWIPMYSDLVYAPVAASGDNVYVTWWTNATGNWDAFLAISRDNGETFDEVVSLTNGTGRSFDTRIDAEGDNVYVTWLNNKTGVNQVYMKASADAGETFGDEVMINDPITGIEGKVAPATPRMGHGTPVIASGDNVYMTWFENATGLDRPEVFFKASNDAGETFGDVINLSNSANTTSDDPAIAAEGENVYVTFWDDKTGPRKAFVVASNDNGDTFGNPIMLNATATTNTTATATANE